MKNFSIKMIVVCMFLVLLFLSGCTERQEPKTILPKDKDMVVLAAARHLAPGKMMLIIVVRYYLSGNR